MKQQIKKQMDSYPNRCPVVAHARIRTVIAITWNAAGNRRASDGRA